MDTFLAICQGIGLAIAVGLGGVISFAFAAALANLDAGWNLDGADFGFVGEPWFLLAAVVLSALVFVTRRNRRGQNVLFVAIGLAGGLAFAASLDEQGLLPWPGFAAGALLALGVAALSSAVLEGAARRAAAESGGEQSGREQSGAEEVRIAATESLVVVVGGASIGLVVAALFLPPIALPVLVGLFVVAVGRRRAAGRRYAGLRILR